MRSKIYLTELVENKDRKFGSVLEYYPTRVELVDGTVYDALFTKHEIDAAMVRAQANYEDIPRMTFLERIFK